MLSVRDERFHLQLVLQREYLHVQSQLVLQKRLQQRKQSAELTGVWTPALPEFRRRLVLAAGQRGCAPRWLSRHETYPALRTNSTTCWTSKAGGNGCRRGFSTTRLSAHRPWRPPKLSLSSRSCASLLGTASVRTTTRGKRRSF